jgi:tellurite resistance protein
MDRQERSVAGNKLIAVFNLMWDKAISNEQKEISYRDMTRIADAIRHEGPEILCTSELPASIESGLLWAIGAVDPDRERAKENFKKATSALTGVGGLTLTAICFSQILNPGIWAIIVAFFTGGIAAGPFAVAGVAVGLAFAGGALYMAYQSKSPQERAVIAHKHVLNAINHWIKNGEDKIQIKNPLKDDKKNLLSAMYTILVEVASVNGVITEEEKRSISNLTYQNKFDLKSINLEQAFDLVSKLSTSEKEKFVSDCVCVAFADGQYERSEINYIEKIRQKIGLTVDYTEKEKNYRSNEKKQSMLFQKKIPTKIPTNIASKENRNNTNDFETSFEFDGLLLIDDSQGATDYFDFDD